MTMDALRTALRACRLVAVWLVLASCFAEEPSAACPEEASCAPACEFTTADAWMRGCADAEDCTSEGRFCACCAVHPHTEYAEACGVFCSPSAPAEAEGFGFDEFYAEEQPEEEETGPSFDQPEHLHTPVPFGAHGSPVR